MKSLIFIFLLCINNANGYNIQKLEKELLNIGLKITAQEIFKQDIADEDSLMLAKHLNKVPQTHNNDILRLEITNDNIDTKIILFIPIIQNIVKVVNFVSDGIFVDSNVLEFSSVNRNGGSVRFLPTSAISDTIEVSIVSEAKISSIFSNGILFNKKSDMEKNKQYLYYIPIINIISKVLFLKAKQINLHGTSLGLAKLSLSLSQGINSFEEHYIDFSNKLTFIFNWSGLLSPNTINLRFLPSIALAISQPILTDISAKNELQIFADRIDFLSKQEKYKEKIFSLYNKRDIDILLQKLSKFENADVILVKMLLNPFIISIYTENDMIIDGAASFDYIKKRLLFNFYKYFPLEIQNAYHKVCLKYSIFTESKEYDNKYKGLIDFLNHNPDQNQLIQVFNLQLNTDKIKLITEVVNNL